MISLIHACSPRRMRAAFQQSALTLALICLAWSLSGVVQAQKPIPCGPNARTEADFMRIKREWLLREIVAPYDTVGKKNPAYDEKARAFLQAFALDPAKSNAAQMKLDGEALSKAGCDDPLFLRAYASIIEDDSALATRAMECQKKALEGFVKGKYPRVNIFYSAWKCCTLTAGAGLSQSMLKRTYQNTAMQALAQAILAGEFRPNEQQIAYRLAAITCNGSFNKARWVDLYFSLKNNRSVDSWLQSMIEGEAEYVAALQARGTGKPNEVSEENRRLIQDHITKSHAALTAAHNLHPEYPEAAATLIELAMSGATRYGENARLWFDASAAAQMDYEPAYNSYLLSLRPMNGGSHENMYLFGLECLNTKRYDTSVPMMYLSAMKEIASDYEDANWHAAFQQPKVFECLEQLFDGMQKANEGVPVVRDRLLAQRGLASMWCGKYNQAKAAFAAVQDKNMEMPQALYNRVITPIRINDEAATREVSALISPQGPALLDAWSLVAAGQGVKAKPLLVKAFQEAKGNPRICAYIANQYGFVLLSENSKGKINPALSELSAMHMALITNRPDVALELIKCGADLNLADYGNWTPLTLALQNRHAEVARQLIERKVDYDVVNKHQWGAIHMALQYGFPDLAKQIIENGANVNLPGLDGLTPLHYAVHHNYGDLAKLLIEKGANPNSRSGRGESPLTTACRNGNLQIVQILLEHGADLNLSCVEGNSPMIYAIDNGHPRVAIFLIEKGADAKLANKHNNNALHYAASKGYADLVRLLLKKGCDARLKDKDGDTPLDIARKRNQQEVVGILSAL